MSSKHNPLVILVLIAFALILWMGATAPPEQTPLPMPPAPVQPCPGPDPCPVDPPSPPPRPRPWGPGVFSAVAEDVSADNSIQAKVGGPKAPDGTELDCDLPVNLHQKNTGGSDGAGLCVFASMRHSGLWQNNPVFAAIFSYMKRYPGGGYPDKVDRVVERYCQEKGIARPRYIQIQSKDLEILKLASKTGRMPGVTYSFSPSGRYGGQRISHMVSLPHADDKHFVVLDNNYPGSYEWLTPQEFSRTYTGWAIILLDPGPPPIPKE